MNRKNELWEMKIMRKNIYKMMGTGMKKMSRWMVKTIVMREEYRSDE